MTDFQKTCQAVQAIASQLDFIAQKIAHEPRTPYEAQNTYCCISEELRALQQKLEDGASLPLKVQGFLHKAEETDPNKQLYGEGMREKVRALAAGLEEQRGRRADLQMVLQATHDVWEERRLQEEEARLVQEALLAEQLEKQATEKRRLQALKEEEERKRDQEIYERLQREEEERKRRAREKKKAKNEKRREREREEKERLKQQEAEKEAARKLAEVQLEEQLAAQAAQAQQSSGAAPAVPPAETGTTSASAERPRAEEEVYTLQTMPEDLYTYTYTAHPIPKSPKAELVIVEPPGAITRCARLVVWKAVLLACTSQTKAAVSFEFQGFDAKALSAVHVDDSGDPEEEEEEEELEAEADDGSGNSSGVVSEEDAELTCSTSPEKPSVADLASFLAAQWDRKQEDDNEEAVFGKRIRIDWMSDPLRLQWMLLLSHGGYFAAAVFVNGKPIVHKSFHRYIVRRKQGGRQSTQDKGNGCMSSVGSQLRRHHEAKWKEKIRSTLTEWGPYLQSCLGIFLHAPGPANMHDLFFEKGPLRRGDPRIQTIPFTTGRPSFEEVRRSYTLLSTVIMERSLP
eukprot:GGOE01003101.1.p1 GENE.GGOE01003101.1~~GGOE01003101.1.p1  ORF type:complete len:579 (-),score=187.96 GGOE01003101.1:346-2061(-)